MSDFAQRSWLHAAAVGVFRFVLLAGVLLVTFLVIMNVLLPNMIDGLVEQFQNRNR